MAILVDERSRVIVQGATGHMGRAFMIKLARYYDNLVGGVAPGRGGQTVAGRHIFDSVAEAVAATQANASVIVVPAAGTSDAVYEALDAGITIMSIYTDLIPIHQTVGFLAHARACGARIVGPNAAGVVSPGRGSISELNDAILRPGRIGIVSKSGSLTYEVCHWLEGLDLGQSTICCLGGDPIIGTRIAEVLEAFDRDEETDGVVLLGEVGGTDELVAAEVISGMHKPVVAYVAGHSAPPGKPMGHAGALLSRNVESAASKSATLRRAGAQVVDVLERLPAALRESFGRASMGAR
ncbi:MAG TPA: succinate--CoA ligase subunit alpha [Candidatus Dormibacteraeota bacterium]|nr:succinate--CoA ligase subunit alpha [Candidatus Dormibacteraeota bacterium]